MIKTSQNANIARMSKELHEDIYWSKQVTKRTKECSKANLKPLSDL